MQRDIVLMLLASAVLAFSMLCLPYMDAVRAWYNRSCLSRQGPQLVQSLPGGELRALSFLPLAGRSHFAFEVLISPAQMSLSSDGVRMRYRLQVDLDCDRNTSQVRSVHSLSSPHASLPGFLRPDNYPVTSGAGWRYALQQKYCG
jgi:hypothetical protein